MFLTGGAQPPVGHFCFVDGEPVGLGGLEAGGLVDRAVDVADGSAGAADDVVVVVAGACLEPCGRPGWFDPAYETLLGENAKGVVHALRARLAKTIAYGGRDVVCVGVRMRDNGVVR